MDRIYKKHYALHILNTPLTCHASKRPLTACVLLDLPVYRKLCHRGSSKLQFPQQRHKHAHTCDGVKGENKIKSH